MAGKLTQAVCIRLAKKDRAKLEELARELPLKPTAIARVAMRLGLARIEEDPRVLLTPR